MQADLWQRKYFEGVDLDLYPLDVYYDDITSGNALGSHSDKTKMGCVYVSLPFLPPKIVSKLSCISLSTVFYSKDRVSLGNIFIFGALLRELDDLSLNGMKVNIDGQEKIIKFRLLSVLGDNLASNACCGFRESFKAANFCRIFGQNITNAKE